MSFYIGGVTMKIKIQKNQIKYDTGKAKLITIPHTKYLVWIPSSLFNVKYWFFEAYLPKKMAFTLTKKDSQKKCSASTLYQMFNHAPEHFVDKVHTPKLLKPKKVEVDDSFKR